MGMLNLAIIIYLNNLFLGNLPRTNTIIIIHRKIYIIKNHKHYINVTVEVLMSNRFVAKFFFPAYFLKNFIENFELGHN